MLALTWLCQPCRMLDEYQARVASEGEYNDDELPAEVLDDVEQQAGKARQHFAVWCW